MTRSILTLVRHGQTDANTGGIWHGSTDTALSPRGHEQAARLARAMAGRIEAVAIYSSDLARTRDTAAPIAAALGLELRTDARLREYDLGSWEGKTYRELHDTHRLWDAIREDPHFAPHGGETPLAVSTRFVGILEAISQGHPGERVIVVTHGGGLSMALGQILDGDYRNWKRVMSNCAVTELMLDPPPATLLSFNENWGETEDAAEPGRGTNKQKVD